jgi:hypothetical protein
VTLAWLSPIVREHHAVNGDAVGAGVGVGVGDTEAAGADEFDEVDGVCELEVVEPPQAPSNTVIIVRVRALANGTGRPLLIRIRRGAV